MAINKKVLAFGATGILALGITGAAVGGHVSNSTADKAYAGGGTATLAQSMGAAQGATGQTSAQAAVAKATGQSGTKVVASTKATTAATRPAAANASAKNGGG